MIAAVNRRREEAGCSPVRLHAALDRAAQKHSAAMARSRRLTHTGADGSSPADRMRAAGYRVGSAGENVAAGADTAEAAVAVWMRSAPHRDILLTCRYTHAGVGRAKGSGGPGGPSTWPRALNRPGPAGRQPRSASHTRRWPARPPPARDACRRARPPRSAVCRPSRPATDRS
ncbi:CAP domain-containing protein [Streptomyces parvulus]|nr:CAP domain-containing protein [Streptomyces parvulus]